MFLVVCQLSINDINVSGKVSSLPLAGEDIVLQTWALKPPVG